MHNCVVLGGGAAGMMAAIAAAEAGAKVTLIEKNEKLGKKVYITGKGRCNVTNDCDADTFFANVISNRKFLYSAFYSFDNNMVMELVKDNGCPLKTERGGRVFPVSDHSSDVLKALNKAIKDVGVEVLLNHEAKDVVVEEAEGTKRVKGLLLKNGKTLSCDSLIMATGGLSYPSTGSTGDGHRILKKLGHSITEMHPGLVPFNVEESVCGELQGLALKNVSLKMYNSSEEQGKKKKPVYDGFGEMLFTHFGISGPLVLSCSEFYDASGGAKKDILIDLKPALDTDMLDKRILRDFDENKNKSFKNSISGLLPSRMIPLIISMCGIDPDKAVNEISREERTGLVHLLKNFPLTVTGTRDYNEAIITRGGVSVKEVDPSTMESKLIDGLYICGEMLDLDAMTGGFNLQIAWSTGHLAGSSVMEKERL